MLVLFNAEKETPPEAIVAKLHQVDMLVLQGQTVAEAIRSIGVTAVSCDRKLATV
jgi:putative transposase